MYAQIFRTFAAGLSLLLFVGATSAQERQWAFDFGDTEAFLIFGVPETDDVGVSFWCRKGSGTIQMFVPGTDPSLPAGKLRKFRIKVAGKTLTRRGLVAADELNGGTTIEARLEERDPLFGLLLDADRFTVVSGPATHTYPMTDADLPNLLDACRKR
ncbi:MAG: hypothetical protein HC855_04715 [Rhizobiales bacterium]|nr:hypothetical protein [Hyphomicrobiales bacterium]